MNSNRFVPVRSAFFFCRDTYHSAQSQADRPATCVFNGVTAEEFDTWLCAGCNGTCHAGEFSLSRRRPSVDRARLPPTSSRSANPPSAGTARNGNSQGSSNRSSVSTERGPASSGSSTSAITASPRVSCWVVPSRAIRCPKLVIERRGRNSEVAGRRCRLQSPEIFRLPHESLFAPPSWARWRTRSEVALEDPHRRASPRQIACAKRVFGIFLRRAW